MKGITIIYTVGKDTYFGVVLDKYREYVTGCSTNQDMYILRRLGSVENGKHEICMLGYIDKVQPSDFTQFITDITL